MSRRRPGSRCYVLDVAGTPVRAQFSAPPTEADRAALAELVRAVQALTPEQIETLRERPND